MRNHRLDLDRQDWLFISGASLVVFGVAIRSVSAALVIAGLFLLLAPGLELLASFIRGLK